MNFTLDKFRVRMVTPDREKNLQADSLTSRKQTDRQTNRQTDRQPDRPKQFLYQPFCLSVCSRSLFLSALRSVILTLYLSVFLSLSQIHFSYIHQHKDAFFACEYSIFSHLASWSVFFSSKLMKIRIEGKINADALLFPTSTNRSDLPLVATLWTSQSVA